MSVPHIGGQHGVVFFGPRDNPRRDRYWAERGLIKVESDDGSYEVLSVREFLLRLNGISDMLGNSKSALAGFAHNDEIERQMRFVEEGVELAKKAKEQGLPPKLGGGVLRQALGAFMVHDNAI